MEHEAVAIETAVSRSLAAGARTADLTAQGEAPLSTRQMGDAVLAAL
jgi:isocitrate/isopropylmalate dehydrogenase